MYPVDIAGERFTWSFVESIAEIDEHQWDVCAHGHPLVRHAFFAALEASGSLGPDRGLIPGYLSVRDAGGDLAAAVPTVLKFGNLREFGPEIHWLQAGLAQGCFAWPKFQACSPLYPQIAPKLLIHPRHRSDTFRAGLLGLLVDMAATRFPTFSLMHISLDDAREAAGRGALISHEPGSQWINPGVGTFDEYVAQLPKRKRQVVRRERTRIRELDLTFATWRGDEASPVLVEDFYAGHFAVCRRYGGRPWVPQSLIEQFCILMPDAVELFTAHDGDRYVAGALRFRGADTLFNQTWSAARRVPGLPFEIACYLSIEYAIDNGLDRIDAGLFIPYKAERGFRPRPVFNAHWFFDDRLAELARTVLSAPEFSAQRLLEVGQ